MDDVYVQVSGGDDLYGPLPDFEEVEGDDGTNPYASNGAVQYVGPTLGSGAFGFKPTFRMNGRHVLQMQLHSDQLNACPELRCLALNTAQYTELKTLKVFAADRPTDQDEPGSAVPLTPNVDGKLLASTAYHVIVGKTRLSCSDQSYAALDALTEDRMPVRIVHLPAELPRTVKKWQHALPKPSSPKKNLASQTSSPLLNGDVALLEVDWPFGKPLRHFFVPRASLEAGDLVAVVGHHGTPDLAWKKFYCMTPDEWPERELTDQAALARFRDLQDWAVHPNFKCVAPGGVVNLNARVVEHSCSVCPGVSGGAGVLLSRPTQLAFFHNVSQANPCRTWAYGTRVTHPVFAYTYLRKVLPRLTNAPAADVRPRAAEIKAFVAHFRRFHEEWGVAEEVDAFFAKYPDDE